MSELAHQVNSNGELARTAPSSNTPCAIGPDGDLAEETRTWPAALREARSFCKQASERVKSEFATPLVMWVRHWQETQGHSEPVALEVECRLTVG